MEPSTTNSNETLPPPTTHRDPDHNHDDRERDHKPPLIISCEIAPRQEANGSSHQPFSLGKEGDKWLQQEEASGVVIPERWGQEDLLKDWMDYSTFDALLAPKGAGSARQALVAEARPNV